jgi:hypothetical protein
LHSFQNTPASNDFDEWEQIQHAPLWNTDNQRDSQFTANITVSNSERPLNITFCGESYNVRHILRTPNKRNISYSDPDFIKAITSNRVGWVDT